jgi:hypothetical protein
MKELKLPIIAGIAGFLIIFFVNIIGGNSFFVVFFRSLIYGAVTFGVFYGVRFIFKDFLNLNLTPGEENTEFAEKEESENTVDFVIGAEENEEAAGGETSLGGSVLDERFKDDAKTETATASIDETPEEEKPKVDSSQFDFDDLSIKQEEKGQEAPAENAKDDYSGLSFEEEDKGEALKEPSGGNMEDPGEALKKRIGADVSFEDVAKAIRTKMSRD